ncbi:MAG TPA: Flp pilus assembly protein CpaB [Pyrinomonadaceae bacterium]|jgi:pilus assembly protein CpaB|nr:Flp pilus assembly protein CpaB [Pyrinomonadaceae bacterium]
MRNKRFLVVLTGALIFGLLTAVSVSRYLSSAQAYNKNLNKVVVARVAIPVGTKIIEDQVGVIQVPKESVPDGTFDTVDKLVGRVAVTNIAPREPVTDAKLAPEGTAGGLSAVIPEGYRAMTVKVDEVVGISGFIQPGALVDIVVVIDPADAREGQGPISKIVLQNIKVLANGQNIDQPKNEREVTTVRAVTLQVTPEQAEKLALSASEGKLQLVMRNSTDQDDEVTPGVNKRGLLTGERAMPVPDPGTLKSEQPKVAPRPVSVSRPRPMPEPKQSVAAPASAPATPPPPRNTVEMIEGAKKRSVDFP